MSTTDMQEVDLKEGGTEEANASTSKRCCKPAFGGFKMAQGYAINGTARGAIVMSNIFLATSFVFLANDAAGCLAEPNEEGQRLSIQNCKGRVYGMAPAAVVSNLAVVAGVVSAFCMPIFGAILDYTSHRKLVGVSATVLMIVIQAVQIGTVQKTWFVMLVLQAVSGVLYQIEVLAIYAYLPEMGRILGQMTMTKYHSNFTAIQFSAQLLFLMIVIALQITFSWATVPSAQYSQAINTVWISLGFGISWMMMDRVPPQRTLGPQQRSFVWEGFIQVGRTSSKIYRDFRSTLGVFYPAVMFSEAACNAFTTISVIFLADHIGMKSSMVGIFFVCALLGVIPGTQIGAYVTKLINPKNSWRLALSIMVVVTIVGAFSLNRESGIVPVFAWGFAVGITLGWHYPVEGLIYSLLLPRGQDSEFAGFYIYCTQILVWLPPLVFSGLVQRGISQSFGVFVIAMFAVVGIIFISLFPAWDDMLATFAEEKEVANKEIVMPEAANDEENTKPIEEGVVSEQYDIGA